MAAYMSKRLEHILQDICRTHKLEFFLINPARIVSNWSWVAKGPHWERIPICFSSLRTCCNRTFASESACFEMQLARPSGIFTASWIVCIRFTACSISGSVVALLHWSSAHIPKRCEWLKIAVSQGSRFSNLCACCTATANSTGSGPSFLVSCKILIHRNLASIHSATSISVGPVMPVSVFEGSSSDLDWMKICRHKETNSDFSKGCCSGCPSPEELSERYSFNCDMDQVLKSRLLNASDTGSRLGNFCKSSVNSL